MAWGGGAEAKGETRRDGEDCNIVLAELCRLTLNICPSIQPAQNHSLAGGQSLLDFSVFPCLYL